MRPLPARIRPFPVAALLAAALLFLTACGGAQAPAPTTVKQIAVAISERTVTPPPSRIDVAKGQTVRITVTSDVADQAHVHGYDKAADLKPGSPATIEFVADQSGLFEVETHGQELQLFQLLVR
ncbi:cupredoxin domain-containing protein [Sphaerisporangium rhizosphaerae]|uniref:EfeO-type cupredoxin-like domain-containing protein n=1 Tax=Sphaerisporangium rhizosphaerae TaxID=2269375 RepID=A0ABW2P1E5_9ACTN